MLSSFDEMVLEFLECSSNPYSDLTRDNFCTPLRAPGALQQMRTRALRFISRELQRVYTKGVVVLIDEYDLPMHSAIEHGYADLVCSFILLY
jgi:hypothetical protein